VAARERVDQSSEEHDNNGQGHPAHSRSAFLVATHLKERSPPGATAI